MVRPMQPISPWEFDIYALSLPRGHGFGDRTPVSAWRSADGLSCGVVTQDFRDGHHGILIMRRRVDDVWTVVAERHGFRSQDSAHSYIELHLRDGQAPEPIPTGITTRPPLYNLQGRTPSKVFSLLTMPSHHPAAWTLNQLYLALPKPDKNWASDLQTANFHTRLWEAQLLASMREQGLLVTQPHDSPDFRIENRRGCVAWIEAVTANPPVPYNHVNAPRSKMPTEPWDSFFGASALRFAKTLGNKLSRHYERMPHVTGHPFMIAITDFQASGSMIWSRDGLIGYLFGEGAHAINVDGAKRAKTIQSTHILGNEAAPIGLFADDRHWELSAIIFSNARSIAKLNRVAVSGRGAPEGFRYTRFGAFFDRTPGALTPIPFCHDVTTDEYRGLWPHGYEPWSAELEVFHNPYARYPVPIDLLPEACHWFEQDGERVCQTVYETSILWSQTLIQNDSDPPLSLDAILRQEPIRGRTATSVPAVHGKELPRP